MNKQKKETNFDPHATEVFRIKLTRVGKTSNIWNTCNFTDLNSKIHCKADLD